ncbi:MAG: cyanophycin synthetase, partial [Acidobacteriota bacterium]
DELEVPLDVTKEALATFGGVGRRFSIIAEIGGVTLVDDYGHHPAEIRVTLEALRLRAGGRRTVVLFQPHRFTRTAALWDDFCRAFHQADVLLVTDIYAAGEEPLPGVNGEALAKAIAERGHRHAAYAGPLAAAAARLAAEVKEGDVVLTLGAGSVWTAGEDLLKARTREVRKASR